MFFQFRLLHRRHPPPRCQGSTFRRHSRARLRGWDDRGEPPACRGRRGVRHRSAGTRLPNWWSYPCFRRTTASSGRPRWGGPRGLAGNRHRSNVIVLRNRKFRAARTNRRTGSGGRHAAPAGPSRRWRGIPRAPSPAGRDPAGRPTVAAERSEGMMNPAWGWRGTGILPTRDDRRGSVIRPAEGKKKRGGQGGGRSRASRETATSQSRVRLSQ